MRSAPEIYILQLCSMDDEADSKGANPFAVVDGVYGLPTFDPTQIDPFTRNIDTKAIYKRLSDNLQSWST